MAAQRYFLDRPIEDYSWTSDGIYHKPDGSVCILPNNRAFPEWITSTFAEYRITSEPSIDSNVSSKDLFPHQKFIRDYMAPDMPYRGILLNHDLGSGKTNTAITTAEQYRQLNPRVKILVLLPATLKPTWMKEIKSWGASDVRRPANYESLNPVEKGSIDQLLDNRIEQSYRFVSYNASNTVKKLKEEIIAINKYNGFGGNKLTHTLVVVDEVHGFISMMVNGVGAHNKGHQLYDILMDVIDCKFLFLSATPLLNTVFELALMFNILRGYMTYNGSQYTLFPAAPGHPESFERIFVDVNAKKIKNAELFKRRILGLTSYYFGGEGDIFPSVVMRNIIECTFTPHQFSRYLPIRNDEKELENRAKRRRARGAETENREDISSTFRVYSRQFSNYTFPDPLIRPINSDWYNIINPHLDPDPNQWSPKQTNWLLTIFENDKSRLVKFVEKYRTLTNSIERNNMIAETVLTEGKADTQYSNIGNTEEQFSATVLEMPTDYKDAVRVAMSELEKNPENFNEKLHILGPKMDAICRFITREAPQGPCFVYSQFRSMEGITIFADVLKAHGFTQLNPMPINNENIKRIPAKNRYMIYSGDEPNDVRDQIREVFNNVRNVRGNICRVLLGTAASAEGITLKNVRQVHIMEPYWNEVRIQQVIGRARRIRSHVDLPVEERNIHVFRYHMVMTKEQSEMMGEAITTDQAIYTIAEQKKQINQQFLQLLKDGAIDCELNYTHNNTANNPVNCFSFGVGENSPDAFMPNIQQDKVDKEISTLYKQSTIYVVNVDKYVLVNGILTPRQVSYPPGSKIINVIKQVDANGHPIQNKINAISNNMVYMGEVYYNKEMWDQLKKLVPIWAIVDRGDGKVGHIRYEDPNGGHRFDILS